MKFLRIWFVCSVGFGLSLLFDWSFGFFAILTPVFVLNISDNMNLPAMVMTVLGGIIASIEGTLAVEFFQTHPVLMCFVVAGMLLTKCIAMMYQATFLYGFAGLLVGSIVLNFASYDAFDISDFNVNLWVILLVVIALYLCASWLFPNRVGDDDPAPLQAPPVRTERDKVGQVAMGWAISMAAFTCYQIFDLIDSLSALVSVLIILAPMTLTGSVAMGKVRVIGTAMGCCAGLIIHVILGQWFSHSLLFWLAYTIAVGIFCFMFSKGPVKSGLGFSAIGALTVPMTTAVVPNQQDAVFSILYRFSAVFTAVVVAVVVMWIIDRSIVTSAKLRV